MAIGQAAQALLIVQPGPFCLQQLGAALHLLSPAADIAQLPVQNGDRALDLEGMADGGRHGDAGEQREGLDHTGCPSRRIMARSRAERARGLERVSPSPGRSAPRVSRR